MRKRDGGGGAGLGERQDGRSGIMRTVRIRKRRRRGENENHCVEKKKKDKEY